MDCIQLSLRKNKEGHRAVLEVSKDATSSQVLSELIKELDICFLQGS